MNAAKPDDPSLGKGVLSVFRALGFLVMRPGLWPYAIVPVVLCGVILVALASVGIAGTSALVDKIEHTDGVATAAVWFLKILLWLVTILLSFVLAAALAQPLSGFALDALSQRQEAHLGGPARTGPSFFPAIFASLKVTLLGLFVGLPLLVMLAGMSFLFPPLAVVTIPLKLTVVALLAAWDLLDYPFSLRNMGVRDRLRFFSDHFGAVLGFGLTTALLLLVPGIGLFLLPIGVIAGTRIVVSTERPVP